MNNSNEQKKKRREKRTVCQITSAKGLIATDRPLGDKLNALCLRI